MKQRPAFTIIEVLTVILVFSILVGISGFVYSTALKRSADQRRITDLASIKSALELYYLDHKSFPIFEVNQPIALAEWQLSPDSFVGCGNSPTKNYLVPKYLNKIPRDPKTNLTNNAAGCSAYGGTNQSGEYLYFSDSKETGKTGYLLAAMVERSQNINWEDSDTTSLVTLGYGNAISGLSFCSDLGPSCTHNYKVLAGRNN